MSDAKHATPEPFGYFRPTIDGWEDCREGDEGARALYEGPQPVSEDSSVAGQPFAATDDWRKYAKEREDTAQAVIERHRREHDSLLRLLAADRGEIDRLRGKLAKADAQPTQATPDHFRDAEKMIADAVALERERWSGIVSQAVSELEELDDETAQIQADALRVILGSAQTAPVAQPQPLTDDQVAELMCKQWGCASIAPRHAPDFARAIETECAKQWGVTLGAHGIGQLAAGEGGAT